MTEQTTLISEELTLAGEASPVTPEIIALNSHRITTETQLKDQEYLFKLQGKPCFPRCDVTTITGPAKSGKTFFVSMLMACCIQPYAIDILFCVAPKCAVGCLRYCH